MGRMCTCRPRSRLVLLLICTSNYVFAPRNDGAMQTLPRKIMEQCRPCPAKSRSLHTLPRKITEPSNLAPSNYGTMQTLSRKTRRYSFRGQNNNNKKNLTRFCFFFLPLFVNQWATLQNCHF